MKYLNCYILKTEIVDLRGESAGELSQYLLQVDRYSIETRLTKSTFIYLNDIIEEESLEELIVNALKEAKIIKDRYDYVIDVNNSAMVINVSRRKDIIEQ